MSLIHQKLTYLGYKVGNVANAGTDILPEMVLKAEHEVREGKLESFAIIPASLVQEVDVGNNKENTYVMYVKI